MNMYEGRSRYADDRRVYMFCTNSDERVCDCLDEQISYQIHKGRLPAEPADAARLLWEQLPRDLSDALVRVLYADDPTDRSRGADGWSVFSFDTSGSGWRRLSVEPYPSADCALDAIFGGPR